MLDTFLDMDYRGQGYYLAYLMRIWQVNDAGKLAWRASLENPHTGERQGFASLEGLIASLWEQIRNSKREAEFGQDDNSV